MAVELRKGLTLYFARHGQTEANVQKRFQGWSKDTALTAKGRDQAQDIGDILARELPDPNAFAFVASPLPRARTTMDIIRATMGLSPGGYTTDVRISEINLGLWDGLTDHEARALDPEKFDERLHDKWDVRVPGGENYADVARRAEDWLADLRADTFAVSHGAFTRILRGLFLGLGWKAMSDLDEPQGCVFRVRDGKLLRLDP